MYVIETGWKVVGLESSVSGEGPVALSCEHGNELLTTTKGGKFLE
jgi:hypothetical protein